VKFQGVEHFTELFSGVRGPNFTNLGKNIGRLSMSCKFVSEFGYIAAFSNAGGSKSSDFKNDTKFRSFWPTVKIRGGLARSLDQLMKLYLRPNLENAFDGHPLCG